MKRIAVVLVLCLLPFPLVAQEKEGVKPVAKEELLRELKDAPKTNAEREKKIAELFTQAGAPKESVTLQEVGKVGHNVIVVKRGKGSRTILVGGHLDKVPPGTGVIDDWSGAAMVTNVYQAFRDAPTEHTLIFIGYCGEERGLLGSRFHAGSMSEEDARKCDAMVNLEVLGVGGPFLWTNGSTDALEAVAHEVAKEEKLKLEDHVIEGVGADNLSYEKLGIPNITIDGLPVDRMELIHSAADRYENIDGETYCVTYRLVLAYLRKLDRLPPRQEPAGKKSGDREK